MSQETVERGVWVTADPKLARRAWRGMPPPWAMFPIVLVFSTVLVALFVLLVGRGPADELVARIGLPDGDEGLFMLFGAIVALFTLMMTYNSWASGRNMPDDLVAVEPERFGLDLRYGPDYKDDEGDMCPRRISAIMFVSGVDRAFTLPKQDGDRVVRARFAVSQGQIRYDGDENAGPGEDRYAMDPDMRVVKDSVFVP
ncbi:hypothetical protein [Bifidobacterium avesanii]|uniref:Uncharacterized protein n=1 Tax=Bifidobacterium avesanii TaxID=1798157 RepID=A0A7K3TH49_9BIFI|nr:hypothetical protein [Bifidobacterium avesanii]KAB8292774.1 hypothetical protein DSM100685_0785 [Bifidobacterium avesanii]NEG78382.1 hypothetical protein [Bifidobacterium avesanii]